MVGRRRMYSRREAEWMQLIWIWSLWKVGFTPVNNMNRKAVVRSSVGQTMTLQQLLVDD